ncbi:MAG: AAA family ATPase [Marinifilaceae bacterium]
MEKLKIDNFLGLKDINIQINDFNVIIGPQASGKSLIAKLIYYSKSIFEEMYLAANKDYTKTELKKELRTKFERFFPKSSWINSSFDIEYSIDDYTFSITNKWEDKDFFFIEFSDEVEKVWKDLVVERKDILDKYKLDDVLGLTEASMKLGTFKDYFNNLIPDIAKNQQVYVPAGRSFFALLQSSIFSILSSNQNIDPLLQSFGALYEKLKPIYADSDSASIKMFDSLVSEILKGKYLLEKGKDYLLHEDGRKIEVSYCSSGQQEILPLVIVLRFLLSASSLRTQRYTVYIEEPEAHIFPMAQKKMIDILSLLFNNINVQFIVTTHSPYVLTSLNNNLQAGLIRKEADSEKLDKLFEVIHKDFILKSESVSAFSIENGNLRSIIEEESELISADLIDDVSNVLGAQFDELLDLIDYGD